MSRGKEAHPCHMKSCNRLGGSVRIEIKKESVTLVAPPPYMVLNNGPAVLQNGKVGIEVERQSLHELCKEGLWRRE